MIEHNSGNACRENSYFIDYNEILGYDTLAYWFT